jgi:hypothetical protein
MSLSNGRTAALRETAFYSFAGTVSCHTGLHFPEEMEQEPTLGPALVVVFNVLSVPFTLC